MIKAHGVDPDAVDEHLPPTFKRRPRSKDPRNKGDGAAQHVAEAGCSVLKIIAGAVVHAREEERDQLHSRRSSTSSCRPPNSVPEVRASEAENAARFDGLVKNVTSIIITRRTLARPPAVKSETDSTIAVSPDDAERSSHDSPSMPPSSGRNTLRDPDPSSGRVTLKTHLVKTNVLPPPGSDIPRRKTPLTTGAGYRPASEGNQFD